MRPLIAIAWGTYTSWATHRAANAQPGDMSASRSASSARSMLPKVLMREKATKAMSPTVAIDLGDTRRSLADSGGSTSAAPANAVRNCPRSISAVLMLLRDSRLSAGTCRYGRTASMPAGPSCSVTMPTAASTPTSAAVMQLSWARSVVRSSSLIDIVAGASSAKTTVPSTEPNESRLKSPWTMRALWSWWINSQSCGTTCVASRDTRLVNGRPAPRRAMMASLCTVIPAATTSGTPASEAAASRVIKASCSTCRSRLPEKDVSLLYQARRHMALSNWASRVPPVHLDPHRLAVRPDAVHLHDSRGLAW